MCMRPPKSSSSQSTATSSCRSAFHIKGCEEADFIFCVCAATLNQICDESCRYYFGLSWWVTWFELFILLGSIPVGVSAHLPCWPTILLTSTRTVFPTKDEVRHM